MRHVYGILGVFGLLFVACAGEGADTADVGGHGDVTRPDLALLDTGASDGHHAAVDLVADTITPPPADVPSARDVNPLADLVRGTGALGEPCTRGDECESGLCWATNEYQGCSIACTTDADCGENPLQCYPVREGLSVCGTLRMSGNPSCATHAECRYPFVCRTDIGGCELPECRVDAECPTGRHCHPVTRRCEDDRCVSVAQCTFPLEVCRSDGTCGAPACFRHSDCPPGTACDPQTQTCETPEPCNEEGACPWYTDVCKDGVCIYNPCAVEHARECETCNPNTGMCATPCGRHADCPNSQACDLAIGLCYLNHAPFAIAVVVLPDARQQRVADVAVGATVQLDATAAFDPDGKPLTYAWTINEVPPGITLTPGAPLPGDGGVRPTFNPTRPGTYALGLVVTDETGLVSLPTEIVIYAE